MNVGLAQAHPQKKAEVHVGWANTRMLNFTWNLFYFSSKGKFCLWTKWAELEAFTHVFLVQHVCQNFGWLKGICCNLSPLGHIAKLFMYTHISSEQHCYLPPICTTFLVHTKEPQPSTHTSTLTMVCAIMCTVYLLWLRWWWWCAG